MKTTIVVLAIGFWSTTAASYGATTVVSGCVKDASGKPAAGAKVFAEPVAGDKTYRADTRKSDGCYEMTIGKDGAYRVGVRDIRFASDGPIQSRIRAYGLDLPNIDLSTDVPNAKLLIERLTEAVLSASGGFSRLQVGVGGGNVPVIMAEIPSGFGDCKIQSSTDRDGPTAMWWCSTGGGYNGMRDENAAHSMFETIRDSVTSALGSLGRLRYSPAKSGERCDGCVDRAVWVSPINGIVSLNQWKDKKRNHLVLWAAYNSPMTEEACASIRRNEEPNVDLAKYDSAVNGMREEYSRQLDAALKASLRNIFGAAIGGPAFIGSARQSGVIGASVVSPNACVVKL